jgi:hypothetical protein
MRCRSRNCRLFLAVNAGLSLFGACGGRTPLLVEAASGDAQQTHVSTAGPSTLAFVSDATWPWFDGNLQGPEGPSRGTAALVCVSAVLPANQIDRDLVTRGPPCDGMDEPMSPSSRGSAWTAYTPRGSGRGESWRKLEIEAGCASSVAVPPSP